ncbi:hypothetical protein ACFL27_11835 [candidate division CSSED10-310 bacterium]|uniref:Uncharacterized protein n=1 Tax=candidate division CSSED10-310 bacterium TaxID=2855610 RepID=A0ABV6YXG8_UNCC1
MREATIAIELDSSVQKKKLFKKIKELHISKPLIFKYAIFSEEVPDFIKENKFEYWVKLHI